MSRDLGEKQLTTDERFARLFPLLEEYERRHAADRIADPASLPPLVSIERAHEIRQFHIALKEIEHKFGLALKPFESGEPIMIVDARTELPQGYEWSALIRADGGLEITEWVED